MERYFNKDLIQSSLILCIVHFKSVLLDANGVKWDNNIDEMLMLMSNIKSLFGTKQC